MLCLCEHSHSVLMIFSGVIATLPAGTLSNSLVVRHLPFANMMLSVRVPFWSPPNRQHLANNNKSLSLAALNKA